MICVELALRFRKLVSDQKLDNNRPRTEKMLGSGLSENEAASDPKNENIPSVFFSFRVKTRVEHALRFLKLVSDLKLDKYSQRTSATPSGNLAPIQLYVFIY